MKYRFCCDVKKASGFQAFIVTADNAEDAKLKMESNGGTFDFEEVEVYTLGDPYFIEQVPDDYKPDAEGGTL